MLRKIAIDSRLMPVIVSLNQSDANDPQNQLKLKTQQQNQQIKLVNSRVTFKPPTTTTATTTTTTSNLNDNENVNNTQSSDGQNTLNSSPSPIKTFQLQKSSPILKQVSFTYNPQNMHNMKIIHPSSSSNNSPSTSFLNTIPINSNNSNDLQHTLDKSASTKFIVTSSSASSPIQRNSQLQQQPGKNVATTLSSSTVMSISKPSLIIKKDE